MRRTLLALTPLAILAAVAPAPAQVPDSATADTFALPGIVVTATRVPTPVESLPTPATVWTGAELEAQGLGTVAEVLERSTAATVVRAGSPGAQTSLFLRGGESDYVKVLVDGVAVNDPGGAFDFADLSTALVERVEVVRGPVSVLYGSDAVTGVVHVFTRRGAGAPSVTSRLMAGAGTERAGPGTEPGTTPGTYELWEADAAVTGAAGDLAYTLGGARSWSGGLYPFNNDRDSRTGTVRLAWAPAAGTELTVSSRYTDSRSHFPTDGTGALVDTNAFLDRELWTTSLAAGLRLHDRVTARVQAGLATRAQTTVDEQDGPADTLGVFASDLAWDVTRRTLDARVDWMLPATRTSLGVAWEQAEAATTYTSTSDLGPFDADAEHRRATRGAYLQALARPVSGLDLTVGGRWDDSDTYGTFFTYRLGAVLEPVAGTRVRGALGRGFREPAFAEVFGSGFGDVGNPELEPERSRSRELGLEQELGATRLSVTWFHQRFERLVQYTAAPSEPDDPSYFNVGAAAARGLELEARSTLGRVVVGASYTYLDTEVLDPGLATDAGFLEGEPLLRRPRHAGEVTARARLDEGSLGLTANLAGAREDLDFGAAFPAPRVTLPGYTTLDLSAEHSVPMPGPDAAVLLRVQNLLDADYQSIAGF
ncbi:MAG: TonB-dependent receptor plug domain-containing protein, partial [Gemmatimonadota bacterium]